MPRILQLLRQGQGLVSSNQPLTVVLFTFLGEKLSAVLPGSDHFAWDLPKELHDQSDVVCPSPHTSQREQARFSKYSMHTHQHDRLCGTETHCCPVVQHGHAHRHNAAPLGGEKFHFIDVVFNQIQSLRHFPTGC